MLKLDVYGWTWDNKFNLAIFHKCVCHCFLWGPHYKAIFYYSIYDSMPSRICHITYYENWKFLRSLRKYVLYHWEISLQGWEADGKNVTVMLMGMKAFAVLKIQIYKNKLFRLTRKVCAVNEYQLSCLPQVESDLSSSSCFNFISGIMLRFHEREEF